MKRTMERMRIGCNVSNTGRSNLFASLKRRSIFFDLSLYEWSSGFFIKCSIHCRPKREMMAVINCVLVRIVQQFITDGNLR